MEPYDSHRPERLVLHVILGATHRQAWKYYSRNTAPHADNSQMGLRIPAELAFNCSKARERAQWLLRLPGMLQELENRWSLRLGPAFEEASCAWVAPVTLRDGTDAVLKMGMPHMEAEHELAGLLFWDSDPTVRVLESDNGTGAMPRMKAAFHLG